MAAAIGLRGDFDAGAMRAVAKRSKDGRHVRRLLALAAIYDGATRSEAAKIGGVTLQIVRDWVLKFNAHGRSWRADRSRRFMGSCAGGSSILANGFSRSSGSSSPGRR